VALFVLPAGVQAAKAPKTGGLRPRANVTYIYAVRTL
jgi:hypothetical protein